MNKINLGDLVEDPVSGISGIAIAITEWLVGCRRVTIQPQAKKGTNEVPNNFTADEPILVVKKRGAVPVPNSVAPVHGETRTGGPLPFKVERH